MKMRNTGALLAILIMSLFQSTTIVFAANNLGKGQLFPPPMLDGIRIELEEGPTTLSTDSPVFVIHGWDLDNWKSRSKVEQRDFLENHIFELYIDGERIELRGWKHYYADQDLMKVGFYVEFDAGHFRPGAYVFKGVWSPGGAKETTVVRFRLP